jgi:hypothetical protein
MRVSGKLTTFCGLMGMEIGYSTYADGVCGIYYNTHIKHIVTRSNFRPTSYVICLWGQ